MIRSIFKQSWESVVSPEEEEKFTVEVFPKKEGCGVLFHINFSFASIVHTFSICGPKTPAVLPDLYFWGPITTSLNNYGHTWCKRVDIWRNLPCQSLVWLVYTLVEPCLRWDAHWCQLTNMINRSVRGGWLCSLSLPLLWQPVSLKSQSARPW